MASTCGRKPSIAAGENPLLRSLRSRVCSGGSMKISHKPNMRASSLNSPWLLSGSDSIICCARFAESLGSFAAEEHSAWPTIDHNAPLPSTSRECNGPSSCKRAYAGYGFCRISSVKRTFFFGTITLGNLHLFAKSEVQSRRNPQLTDVEFNTEETMI